MAQSEPSSETMNPVPKKANEVQLNVANFFNDQEYCNLILAEEAAQALNERYADFEEDSENIYECVIGSSVYRMTRSSVLIFSLYCTIAVAVIIVLVVLLCTFLTFSSPIETPQPGSLTDEEVVGIMNLFHYPVGDLRLPPRV